MKKLKKIDLSGVKDFLFQKGERIALAICGALAVLLVAVGLMKAVGASTTYARDFKTASDTMTRLIAATPGKAEPLPPPKIDEQWPMVATRFTPTPLVAVPDSEDNKKRNPIILAVPEDDKHIQVDPLRGAYFAYEIVGEKVLALKGAVRANQQGANQARPGQDNLAKIMKPLRGVIVTAVYPFKKQMEEFQQKLQYKDMAALQANPQDMPQFIGLNVSRCEVLADGKYSEWLPIYKWDPKEEKLEVADRIRKLLQEAVIDEDNPKTFAKEFVQPRLMTPLPLLANLHYPAVKLPDIKQDQSNIKKARRTGQPKRSYQGPGAKKNPLNPAGNEAETEMVNWTTLSKPLQDQLMGKLDFFDPSGVSQEKDPAQNPTVTPVKKGPGRNAAGGVAKENYDAVIRFIDVDLEPGKTYAYAFQVRMANPNYGQKDEVAFQGLAEEKELAPPPYTVTPPVTIPGEYYYYAVDQKPAQTAQTITGGSDTGAAVHAPAPYGLWSTPVQIHRWLDKAGTDVTVADWAIAERLLVRRGDTIGRYGVIAEVPIWNKTRETFEIGHQAQNAVKGKQRNTSGLPIDFIRDNPPPLLVDFEGGWKNNTFRPGATKDESAVEMLILTPDNKLVLRNSREDTGPGTELAKDRIDRHKAWQEELNQLRGSETPAGAGIIPSKKQ